MSLGSFDAVSHEAVARTLFPKFSGEVRFNTYFVQNPVGADSWVPKRVSANVAVRATWEATGCYRLLPRPCIFVRPMYSFLSRAQDFKRYQLVSPCDANTACALYFRVLTRSKELGQYLASNPGTVQHLLKVAKLFAVSGQRARLTPMTMQGVLDSMRTGEDALSRTLSDLGFHLDRSKLPRYQRAYDEWAEAGYDGRSYGQPNRLLLRKYSFIRAFAKVEMLPAGKWPRLIQPRDPKFNLHVAQFTKPMEAYYYSRVGVHGVFKNFSSLAGRPWSRWIGKGLNPQERGELFWQKYHGFKAVYGVFPLVTGLDCTGFDAHVTEGQIKAEWAFYRRSFPAVYADDMYYLQHLMERAHGTIGSATYSITATRMSGDMHTGFGNSVLTCMMVCGALRGITKRFDLLDDGDDCLVLFHPDDGAFRVTEALHAYFWLLGHELKVDPPSDDWRAVSWCQCKLVRVLYDGRESFMFVPDIRKSIGVLGSHVHMREPVTAQRYLEDVLYAYSVVYQPVSCFARMREGAGVARRNRVAAIDGNARNMVGKLKAHACASTDADYCRAFGLSPGDVECAGAIWDEAVDYVNRFVIPDVLVPPPDNR